MATSQQEVTITNRYGLHARPAMQIVELANRYGSKVEISNRSLVVDAKSIMSVMRLAATKGTVLTIRADGADAEQAVRAIVDLIQDGFGEMERKAEAELGGEG